MRPPRWVFVFAMLLSLPALAQDESPSSSVVASDFVTPDLPDSPGATWSLEYAQQQAQAAASKAIAQQNPCPVATPGQPAPPCPDQKQYRPFLDANKRIMPLTVRQKARLAVHDVVDPFNLLTAAGGAAYFVGTNPHSGYGPGMKGFAYNLGVSLSQDATGEAIGTFAVNSIFHEDPRYFRMPRKKVLRRVGNAFEHVVVARGDDGHRMLNYSSLITNPVTAEIANLYVPGVGVNGPSTIERIVLGFAFDPIGNLVAEFLPDIASRIHIHILFVQRILNQISQPNNNQNGLPGL